MGETLINPPWYRNVITFFRTPSRERTAALYALAIITVLGAVLYASSRIMIWRSDRAINKLKTNINAATVELIQAQANINADERDVEVKLENVKTTTNTYVESIHVSDGAKTETNMALQNLSNAVHAKHPVGTTAEDLQRRLDALDK